MTRSGAALENLATGDVENISSRPAEDGISEQPVNTAGKALDRIEPYIPAALPKRRRRKQTKLFLTGWRP